MQEINFQNFQEYNTDLQINLWKIILVIKIASIHAFNAVMPNLDCKLKIGLASVIQKNQYELW